MSERSWRTSIGKRSILNLAAASALAVAACWPTGAQADTCAQRNFVDGINLVPVGRSTVRVTGSDGTYDHIEPVGLTGDIRVDLCGDGAVDAVIVHFGSCSGHQPLGCTFHPIMYMEYPRARSFRAARDFHPFTITPDLPAGQTILQKCNAVADAQQGAANSRTVDPESFFVTLGVDTRRDRARLGGSWVGGGFDAIAHGIMEPDAFRPLDSYTKTRPVQFTVNVECAPLPQPIKAPPQPVSVNLTVQPKGDTCPKETEVTALIYYDEPAVAQFRFKLDGKLSDLYTREAVKVGGHGQGPVPKGNDRPARYLVQETKTYFLDPGQHHFRVEVRGGKKSEVITRRTECPPFKVFSSWLNYDVENKLTCPKEVDETATFKATRPGKAPFEIKTQGGLVVHSGTAVFERKGKEYRARVKRNLVMSAFDQDMMAFIKDQPDANSGWTRLKVECLEVLSGTLELREFAAARCEGEAAFSIRSSMPGELPYQLDCTGGKSWSDTAQAQQTGPNTFIAAGVKRFDVSNNEQVNCALKTRAPLPVEVLALKGNKYQCHKPSGASGSSDLSPETTPPDLPPSHKLTGDFSFVDPGSPRCPRKPRALINFVTDRPDNVHYSLDCTHGSFSGVAKALKNQKGGYIAPASITFDLKQTVEASCALKTVAPGKPQVHKLKLHRFQCITPTGVPGASDLAPPGRPDPKAPTGPGRLVVDPPRTLPPGAPKVSCAGGVVRNGRCDCARTHKPVQAAANAWRCVRIVVTEPPRLQINSKAAAAAAAARKAADQRKAGTKTNSAPPKKSSGNAPASTLRIR